MVVHTIGRLARNRADDVAINMAIRESRARLISCTETGDNSDKPRPDRHLEAEFETIEHDLDATMGLLNTCRQAYLASDDDGHRRLNQALFQKLCIVDETV